MGWRRGTSPISGRPLRGTTDSHQSRGRKALATAPLWAPVLLVALGCNSDAVAPPVIFVPGQDTVVIAPCEGSYCNESLLGIYGMHAYYRKIIATNQVPVVGSHLVQDRALELAVDVAKGMIEDRELWWAFLVEAEAFIAVMSVDEVTTDIPEHKFLENDPDIDWNSRARGLGATLAVPLTTVGEENLLCLSGDVYGGESILVHEFAHSLHALVFDKIDPSFDAELDSLFWQARAEGLWTNTYANESRQEYWAEGVQSWFSANQMPQDGIHNHVNTREELAAYDPRLHELIGRWFSASAWSPMCPSG
jgi:hypothetical protein